MDSDRDDRVAAVRTYYRAVDAGAYDDLRAVLAPGFVQDRGDRTFEGREAFVSFMRDERPDTDTTHDLRGVYVAVDGDVAPGAAREVLARGVVRRADGAAWFRFVDAFAFDDDGAITRLVTFARDAEG
jgi:ketosteroid isomerase-like protein